MKLFHLSDLHIGLKLFNYELREDQDYIFRQIAEYAGAERPDAILIAGDIYDKAVPSGDAVECFDLFISAIRQAAPDAELMLISGNHDSAARVNVFRSLLSHQGIHMIGEPPRLDGEYIEKVRLHDSFGAVNFYLLPFVRPSMLRSITGLGEEGVRLSYEQAIGRLLAREKINTEERNVILSHQFYLPRGKSASSVERMESEICTVGNIDAVSTELLEPFDYAALGHIHKPMKLGEDRFRYSGTPLACSVSEAGQQKSILNIELREKGQLLINELPLHPLRELRLLKGSLNELLLQPSEDYVSVAISDKEELDIMDMQDRLRAAFPRLLEIRREWSKGAVYNDELLDEELDSLSICRSFLGELSEDEDALLENVLHSVEERVI